MDVVAGTEPRAIYLRIDNASDLAANSSQIAAFVGQYAPDTVESMVYDEVASQVAHALREKGAKVDVKVVTMPAEKKGPSLRDSIRDVVVGVLGGLGAGLAIMLIKGRSR